MNIFLHFINEQRKKNVGLNTLPGDTLLSRTANPTEVLNCQLTTKSISSYFTNFLWKQLNCNVGVVTHFWRLQLEALDEGAIEAEAHCKVPWNLFQDELWSFVENLEVVGSVVSIGEGLHTETTNQHWHGEQCEEQSKRSCLGWQVGTGQTEICQQKLGWDCAGWDKVFGLYPTTRIPNSFVHVTKTDTWQYLGNQESYHR